MNTGLFIVPRASTAWRGNEAGWITASGWAAAGQELFGHAMVGTTDGVFLPVESRLFPRGSTSPPSGRGRRFRRFIPELLITAVKDLRLFLSKPGVWPIEDPEVLDGKSVKLVWERHDLFPGPGRRLADKLGVPLVISVEAPVIWEAQKWGVRRPFWGHWLEGLEAKSLSGADLVTCVSEEVMEKVRQMGVAEDKLIVNPNRVDSTVFHPNVDGRHIAVRFGLQGRKVIGWTGSFRNFHGLDSVLMAFSKVLRSHANAVLMLVGDGLEFSKIARMAAAMGLEDSVIFAGRQPFTEVPQFVTNFEVALVSAASSEGFHYSPLKLREYLSAGKAVIAPRAGDLPKLFEDGRDLLFYTPGDIDDLAAKMEFLLNGSDDRDRLSRQAQKLFEQEGTWISELRKVCVKLKISVP